MQTLQTMEAMNVRGSLASSIESLSNINQDLHLKLQQQRMATMMFGGDSQKGESSVALNGFGNQKLLQPVSFKNLAISKPENLPAGSSINGGPSRVVVSHGGGWTRDETAVAGCETRRRWQEDRVVVSSGGLAGSRGEKKKQRRRQRNSGSGSGSTRGGGSGSTNLQREMAAARARKKGFCF
ncbi:hypothetical protein DEO72_LG9g1841 [Vigna unguiculata]|uniref:Uncharacterized protein n=1 Tax=Vigna unguiculata TaxID=3917 RepID=A0A4D6N477_VIGUN|nr:hypothetical protein DEO72_LG9g1841 [Vigna unguiculata]